MSGVKLDTVVWDVNGKVLPDLARELSAMTWHYREEHPQGEGVRHRLIAGTSCTCVALLPDVLESDESVVQQCATVMIADCAVRIRSACQGGEGTTLDWGQGYRAMLEGIEALDLKVNVQAVRRTAYSLRRQAIHYDEVAIDLDMVRRLDRE
jgi:hypothetical protein